MEIRNKDSHTKNAQHVFVIGSKNIGQYGGYETFVDRLIGEHEYDNSIFYHIACKANGIGRMDESTLSCISNIIRNKNGEISEFTYKNAHIFKVPCLSLGSAAAVFYDRDAFKYSIQYCVKHQIENPIFYVLTCRIGVYIDSLIAQAHAIGGRYYLNPDGHEWKRAKWSMPIKKYWKWSEKRMVTRADLIICDSISIQEYIQKEYNTQKTRYVAYGADLEKSKLADHDPRIENWLSDNNLEEHNYYLIVGRFVPENNFETMIREYMICDSKKSLVIISNANAKLYKKLNKKLNFASDSRIKFVGTVYDHELLKKIRELAYGYLHGHEVGGTNPSLLEALSSTEMNLLFDVGFNREVGQNAALYWTKEYGNLSKLINEVDTMSESDRKEFGNASKERIKTAYSWDFIGKEYKNIWCE